MRNDRITGPVPVPARVRAALQEQLVSHRSEEFRRTLREVVSLAGPLFGTAGQVLPFTCSGTGGMEAAVCSVLSAGDRALVVEQGYFGARFAEIAHAYGVQVDAIRCPWGETVPPERVADAVRATRYDAVLLTHNETSTGVLGPLREWAEAARTGDTEPLLIVDAVSSLGAAEIAADRDRLDVVVSVTQKALACPPGLALLSVSDAALSRVRQRPNAGRYYLDIGRMADAVAEGSTTYTPAVSLVFALRESLRMIHEEGLERVWERHRATARDCRERLRAHGLRPVVTEDWASPTVSAVHLSPGLDGRRVQQRLAREHDIHISLGRGAWRRSVVRIGHMGPVDPAPVRQAVAALAAAVAGSADGGQEAASVSQHG